MRAVKSCCDKKDKTKKENSIHCLSVSSCFKSILFCLQKRERKIHRPRYVHKIDRKKICRLLVSGHACDVVIVCVRIHFQIDVEQV